MAQRVRDVMTQPATTVPSDADLTTVARLMRDQGIGAVAVTADQHLKGLVTDRDLVVRGLAAGGHVESTAVGSLCSSELATVKPDDELATATRLMREHSVRRLPVVEGDQVVGILAIGDLAIERDDGSALSDISAAEPNT